MTRRRINACVITPEDIDLKTLESNLEIAENGVLALYDSIYKTKPKV